MSAVSELFDPYALRARIYPGFLAALPIVLLLILLFPKSPLLALWPIVVSVGALFFMANWVRDNGRDIEPGLYEQWGGAPTTQMLRVRERESDVALQRRRRMLSELVDVVLPTQRDEITQASRSDETYALATKALIVRVRAKQDKFPRVQDELTDYGFRRNLLALKKFGLAIAGACLLFDIFWLVRLGDPTTWALLAIHSIVFLIWIMKVDSNWVRRQAELYATRLLESLEDPQLKS